MGWGIVPTPLNPTKRHRIFLLFGRQPYTKGRWNGMRNFKIFAAIADIHIGIRHISAGTFRKQLKKHFINTLMDMKYLDGIFILGDILHTVVSLNSDYAETYLWFIDQVYKVAKKRGATVIIIKGTPSHDNDQLQNIKSYTHNDDGVDFRVYETVEEIALWDDYNVLVLPDVRVRELRDIGKYLTSDKKYDMILGHGLISAMKYVTQESENMPTKVYEYDADTLIDSCKGPVLFGHIHQFQTVRNHFYYVGPFTLLERGGVNAGFVIGGILDENRTQFKIEQFLNPDSASYIDLDVNRKVLAQFPVDEIFDAIDDLIKDTKPNDLITLRITRGEDFEASDKVYLLESRYRKDRRISIVKKVKSVKEEESDKRNEERKQKFSYVMDDNTPLYSIIYKYYQDEYEPTLPDTFKPAVPITEDTFRKILEAVT